MVIQPVRDYVIRPVDSQKILPQVAPVKKKPAKVEEMKAPYKPKPPAAARPATGEVSAVRYASLEKVSASNAKLIEIHREVLRKLAQ